MQEQRDSSTHPDMRKYHAQVNIPKPKNNTIGIIVSYVMLAAILAYVVYDTPAEKEAEVVVEKKAAPEKKIIPKPVAASIVVSAPLWLNAPESIDMEVVEDMRVKFKVANHNAYPVTGVKVEFSFLDIEDAKVGETLQMTLEDVIEANGEISFDDFTLGQYPAETISIAAKVLAVTAAQ
ncbi:MAG: hypothetical protein ACPH5P_08900 [Akkermansiaceae bacterium]